VLLAGGVCELENRATGSDGRGTVLRVVSKLKGQAIVIPLEGQSAMIVPMSAPDADAFTRLYTTSCDIQMGEHESSSEYFTRIADHATPCPVDVSSLRLMHMSDRRDMSTLAVSNSGRARISGREIRIVAASVSKTTKPVTMGIREQLPWLPRYGEAISGGTYRYSKS
jgi:hypothetical protein